MSNLPARQPAASCQRAFVALLPLLLGMALFSPPLHAQSEGPPNVDVDEWLGRVKDGVRRSVERVPADWQRYLPRSQPPTGRQPPSTTGPRWPGLPSLPGVPGGARLSVDDLGRVLVGYQAGILKIVAPDGQTVLFVKDHPGTGLEGIDARDFAPLNEHHRRGIFRALNISENELDATAHRLMREFHSLPMTKAAAVLGAIASTPDRRFSETAASRVRSFLADLLRYESDVKVRRMAVLSLAVAARTDEATVSAVVDFMESSHNAWETFTVQQYFEYHRGFIRSLRTANHIRRRVLSSGNPYGPRICAHL